MTDLVDIIRQDGRAILVDLLRSIDDALEEGRFGAVRALLDEAPATLGSRMLIALVVATFPARKELGSSYKGFYLKAHDILCERHGERYADGNLGGLAD